MAGEISWKYQTSKVARSNTRINSSSWIKQNLDTRGSVVEKHLVGWKWVLKIKRRANGTIEHHKAWLVMEDFTQVNNIDFNETLTPIAKLVFILYLLTVMVAQGYGIHQMDVHNAFLEGDLNEEVYMSLPLDFSPFITKQVHRLY